MYQLACHVEAGFPSSPTFDCFFRNKKTKRRSSETGPSQDGPRAASGELTPLFHHVILDGANMAVSEPAVQASHDGWLVVSGKCTRVPPTNSPFVMVLFSKAN
jgi:hypothetical protein